jgi:copper chaperone CopZ
MRLRSIYKSLRLLGLGAIVAVGACNSSPNDTPTTTQPAKTAMQFDERPVSGPVATLVVHGMGCPQCSSNVDKQLLAVRGVREVHVNLGTGQVTVALSQEQPPTGKQLAAAIKRSGYTLVRIDEGGAMPLESFGFPKTANVK